MSANDVLLLVEPTIAEVERIFGWQILVDDEALEECAIKAEETLGNIQGVKLPNTLKIAGHYAFWIRKLKPFSLYHRDEVKNLLAGLGVLNPETTLPQAPIPTGSKTMFVNEIIAILVACGLVERYSKSTSKINLSPTLMNDWIIGLRYHSYSPSSLSILLEGLMQCHNNTGATTAANI